MNNIDFTKFTSENVNTLCDKYIEYIKETNDYIANLDINTLSYKKCYEDPEEIGQDIIYDETIFNMDSLHPDTELCNTISDCNNRMSDYSIEQSARQDVYNVLLYYYNNQYQEEKDNLTEEQCKYVEKTMISYKMRGFDLKEESKNRVTEINKTISTQSTLYSMNLSRVDTELYFKQEDLEGLPEEWLKQRYDEITSTYKIKLEYPDYIPIMENCKVRETRKIMSIAMGSRCLETNMPIILDTIKLRQEKANLFGYDNFSDYKLQTLMAKDSNTVNTFLNDLLEKIKPQLQVDMDELRKLSLELDNITDLQGYDIAYYSKIYNERTLNINMDEIQKMFSIDSVTNGIFSVYQELLNLTFNNVSDLYPNAIYHKDVKLYSVVDNNTGNEIGNFYLDLFPRKGKYGHAAMFTLMSKSRFNLPLSGIICNFDPILDVSFDNVVTYFHEFGHLMHSMTTRVNIGCLSGTSCERDFVETPSQMFEEWCYRKNVLMRLVKQEYIDTINDDLVSKLNKEKKSLQGIFNARQLCYCFLDMAIHSNNIPNNTWLFQDKLFKSLFGYNLNVGCNMLANWGHMYGYESSYYSYLWSKVYAIDLFSFFKDNEFNQELGKKLIDEILSKGGVVSGYDMLQNFMNRPANVDAYVQWLAE